MKNAFASTHWACFDCRKSFAKEPSETPRKCPECAEPMTDMGAYFEPPRKLNKKDSKIYIQNRILQAKNPRVADVVDRIEELKRKQFENGNE